MRSSWVLVLVIGCGGGSDSPVDATTIDSPPPCTHVQNLRVIRGRAQTFGTSAGQRFDGMICIDGRSDIACVTTDNEKRFELCAPTGEFGLRFTKTGFENTVYLHGTAMFAPTEPFTVGDDAFVKDQIWTPIGGTYPPTTNGHLVVIVAKPGVEGKLADAEVAVLPSAGLTVRYLNDAGMPDTSRTTTAGPGIAVVANVPPGDIDIQVNSATHPNCAFATGGYASPDNTQDARVKIIAGTTVVAFIECRP